MTKRSIVIDSNVGEDSILNLSKVTCIKNIDAEMIHLDKLSDGTWRLIYSEKTISDISDVNSLKIIRE